MIIHIEYVIFTINNMPHLFFFTEKGKEKLKSYLGYKDFIVIEKRTSITNESQLSVTMTINKSIK